MKKMLNKISPRLLLVVVFLWGVCTHAQDATVTGTVTSAQDGQPLPGVNVLVSGTTQGAVTDFDGNYSITASSNATLVFSYIGFTTQEIAVNGQNRVNAAMSEDATSLDEVVLVGYGTQIKREVTGSVQTVNITELADIPVTQVGQKLQGQLAGVQINQTTGVPGEGLNIRIRGQLSVSGGSDPLYVVDGFPIAGNINTINPAEIETLTVLKDAASTSLYGSRAANGVVLITTKQGKTGKLNVSFNMSTGLQTVPQRGRLEMMNSVEFAQFKKEYYEDQGDPVPDIFQNPSQYEGQTNDWYDALLRTAPISIYNLTVSGGSEKFRTSLIAGLTNQDGVVLGSDFQQFTLRANMAFNPSDKVEIGVNVAPSWAIRNDPQTDGSRGTGLLFNALHTWPIMPIFNPDGTRTEFNRFPADTGNIFAYANWLNSAERIKNEDRDLNLLSNAFVTWKPVKGLSIKSSLNAEFYKRNTEFFSPTNATGLINRPIPQPNQGRWTNRDEFNWANENIATYTKDLGDHNFSVLGGFGYYKFRTDVSQISATEFPDDRLPFIQTAVNINRGGTFDQVQENTLVSAFSQLTYNYKGKYLLTGAVRRDGSSRFGSDNRWGTFPSVSAGWIVSDESFLENSNAISLLKLRSSWGVTGNNNIGNYTQYALIDNTVPAVFGDTFAPGAAVNSLSNPNLGWETTEQFDIGLDLSLFNDRVSFVYDYFTKNTTNLLFNIQVPRESGFSNFSDNIGEIRFWGHEFALNTVNTTGKFKWTTSANISFNRNEVVALAEGVDQVFGPGGWHITQVGQPFAQFYGHVSDGGSI